MGILIQRKIKDKITAIFEHPNEVYSVYLKEQEDVIWLEGKIELCRYLRSLNLELKTQ